MNKTEVPMLQCMRKHRCSFKRGSLWYGKKLAIKGGREGNGWTRTTGGEGAGFASQQATVQGGRMMEEPLHTSEDEKEEFVDFEVLYWMYILSKYEESLSEGHILLLNALLPSLSSEKGVDSVTHPPLVLSSAYVSLSLVQRVTERVSLAKRWLKECMALMLPPYEEFEEEQKTILTTSTSSFEDIHTVVPPPMPFARMPSHGLSPPPSTRSTTHLGVLPSIKSVLPYFPLDIQIYILSYLKKWSPIFDVNFKPLFMCYDSIFQSTSSSLLAASGSPSGALSPPSSPSSPVLLETWVDLSDSYSPDYAYHCCTAYALHYRQLTVSKTVWPFTDIRTYHPQLQLARKQLIERQKSLSSVQNTSSSSHAVSTSTLATHPPHRSENKFSGGVTVTKPFSTTPLAASLSSAAAVVTRTQSAHLKTRKTGIQQDSIASGGSLSTSFISPKGTTHGQPESSTGLPSQNLPAFAWSKSGNPPSARLPPSPPTSGKLTKDVETSHRRALGESGRSSLLSTATPATLPSTAGNALVLKDAKGRFMSVTSAGKGGQPTQSREKRIVLASSVRTEGGNPAEGGPRNGKCGHTPPSFHIRLPSSPLGSTPSAVKGTTGTVSVSTLPSGAMKSSKTKGMALTEEGNMASTRTATKFHPGIPPASRTTHNGEGGLSTLAIGGASLSPQGPTLGKGEIAVSPQSKVKNPPLLYPSVIHRNAPPKEDGSRIRNFTSKELMKAALQELPTVAAALKLLYRAQYEFKFYSPHFQKLQAFVETVLVFQHIVYLQFPFLRDLSTRRSLSPPSPPLPPSLRLRRYCAPFWRTTTPRIHLPHIFRENGRIVCPSKLSSSADSPNFVYEDVQYSLRQWQLSYLLPWKRTVATKDSLLPEDRPPLEREAITATEGPPTLRITRRLEQQQRKQKEKQPKPPLVFLPPNLAADLQDTDSEPELLDALFDPCCESLPVARDPPKPSLASPSRDGEASSLLGGEDPPKPSWWLECPWGNPLEYWEIVEGLVTDLRRPSSPISSVGDTPLCIDSHEKAASPPSLKSGGMPPPPAIPSDLPTEGGPVYDSLEMMLPGGPTASIGSSEGVSMSLRSRRGDRPVVNFRELASGSAKIEKREESGGKVVSVALEGCPAEKSSPSLDTAEGYFEEFNQWLPLLLEEAGDSQEFSMGLMHVSLPGNIPTTSLSWQVELPMRSIQNFEYSEEERESGRAELLKFLRLAEFCDILPLQLPLKGRLIQLLQTALDWQVQAREAINFCPKDFMIRQWSNDLDESASVKDEPLELTANIVKYYCFNGNFPPEEENRSEKLLASEMYTLHMAKPSSSPCPEISSREIQAIQGEEEMLPPSLEDGQTKRRKMDKTESREEREEMIECPSKDIKTEEQAEKCRMDVSPPSFPSIQENSMRSSPSSPLSAAVPIASSALPVPLSPTAPLSGGDDDARPSKRKLSTVLLPPPSEDVGGASALLSNLDRPMSTRSVKRAILNSLEKGGPLSSASTGSTSSSPVLKNSGNPLCIDVEEDSLLREEESSTLAPSYADLIHTPALMALFQGLERPAAEGGEVERPSMLPPPLHGHLPPPVASPLPSLPLPSVSTSRLAASSTLSTSEGGRSTSASPHLYVVKTSPSPQLTAIQRSFTFIMDLYAVLAATQPDVCPLCATIPRADDDACWIACDVCNRWYHLKCVGLADTMHANSDASSTYWQCPCCSLCLKSQPQMQEFQQLYHSKTFSISCYPTKERRLPSLRRMKRLLKTATASFFQGFLLPEREILEYRLVHMELWKKELRRHLPVVASLLEDMEKEKKKRKESKSLPFSLPLLHVFPLTERSGTTERLAKRETPTESDPHEQDSYPSSEEPAKKRLKLPEEETASATDPATAGIPPDVEEDEVMAISEAKTMAVALPEGLGSVSMRLPKSMTTTTSDTSLQQLPPGMSVLEFLFMMGIMIGIRGIPEMKIVALLLAELREWQSSILSFLQQLAVPPPDFKKGGMHPLARRSFIHEYRSRTTRLPLLSFQILLECKPSYFMDREQVTTCTDILRRALTLQQSLKAILAAPFQFVEQQGEQPVLDLEATLLSLPVFLQEEEQLCSLADYLILQQAAASLVKRIHANTPMPFPTSPLQVPSLLPLASIEVEEVKDSRTFKEVACIATPLKGEESVLEAAEEERPASLLDATFFETFLPGGWEAFVSVNDLLLILSTYTAFGQHKRDKEAFFPDIKTLDEAIGFLYLQFMKVIHLEQDVRSLGIVNLSATTLSLDTQKASKAGKEDKEPLKVSESKNESFFGEENALIGKETFFVLPSSAVSSASRVSALQFKTICKRSLSLGVSTYCLEPLRYTWKQVVAIQQGLQRFKIDQTYHFENSEKMRDMMNALEACSVRFQDLDDLKLHKDLMSRWLRRTRLAINNEKTFSSSVYESLRDEAASFPVNVAKTKIMMDLCQKIRIAKCVENVKMQRLQQRRGDPSPTPLQPPTSFLPNTTTEGVTLCLPPLLPSALTAGNVGSPAPLSSPYGSSGQGDRSDQESASLPLSSFSSMPTPLASPSGSSSGTSSFSDRSYSDKSMALPLSPVSRRLGEESFKDTSLAPPSSSHIPPSHPLFRAGGSATRGTLKPAAANTAHPVAPFYVKKSPPPAASTTHTETGAMKGSTGGSPSFHYPPPARPARHGMPLSMASGPSFPSTTASSIEFSPPYANRVHGQPPAHFSPLLTSPLGSNSGGSTSHASPPTRPRFFSPSHSTPPRRQMHPGGATSPYTPPSPSSSSSGPTSS
ncbi:hypothetical protein IE077_002073 [Cardiosporidium cionae]|uniref:PHD-type domain-containing protein n=1 Tax=Cardiosporidium cionae TaxID=476202 RepID=A0ABQ7JBR9_9APIC|nr:hypothetical protein IE077_002073 [Cardiosporidium cionae]|eukprot:KAF8821416.1 hypothetical protein IE077_002073 [Cardiosporidium cionae]